MKSDVKLEGGSIKQFSHWSNTCQCEMTFSIFLPQRSERLASDPPVLYYLSGLTCTDENARTKAHFAQEAARVGLAVVFPDTSPRGVDIKGYIFTHQIFPQGSKIRPGDLGYRVFHMDRCKSKQSFFPSHRFTPKMCPF